MTDPEPQIISAGGAAPWATRLGAFVRTHHATLLIAVGALFNLWVVLSVRWLPIQDWGGHIELMDIMARAHDPATIYPELYNTTSPFTANGLCLVLASLFGGAVSAFTIAKVMIAFYVVALPFSIASLAKAFDRPPWLALFASPMVFSAVFGLGFINFIVAMPMLFWSIALGRRFAERGGWKLGLGLTLLMATTVLAHIIAYMMTIAMVFVMIWLHLPSLKKAARLSPVLLSSPIFLSWVYERILANTPTEAGRTFVGAGEGLGTVFYSVDQRIETLHQWGFRFLKNSADDIALVIMLLCWVVLLAVAMRQRGAEPDGEAPRGLRAVLRGYALELMIVGSLVGYFVLPNHLREVAIISERAWFVGMFFLPLMPRVKLTRGTAWIAAVLLFVAVAYPIAVQRVSKRFDRDIVGNLPQAIADLPDKTALAYIKTVHELDMVYQGPHWHIPKALHAMYNGGYTDDNFAIRPYFPVDFKPGKTPGGVDARFWSDNNLFDWDHVLVYQTSEPTQAMRSPKVQLRWHEGPWWLFDVLPPEDWDVPMAGGQGGGAYIDTCPDDRTPVGLEVSHDGKTMSSARLLCKKTVAAKVPDDGAAGDAEGPAQDAADKGRLTMTQIRGLVGEGHEKLRLECGEGQRLVGLHGRADRMVRALGIKCAERGGKVVDIAAVGGPEGEAFDYGCPDGVRARGIKARSGWWLDAIGVVCKKVP